MIEGINSNLDNLSGEDRRKIESPDSRRNFIKLAAILTAGGVLGGVVATLAEQLGKREENKFVLEKRADGSFLAYVIGANEKANLSHDEANKFEQGVGNFLKTAGDFEVQKPNVELRIVDRNGKKTYLVTYTCLLVPSKTPNRKFARLGTMLPGSTPEAAKEAVDEQEKKDKKEEKVKIFSGGLTLQDSFIGQSEVCYKGQCWHIREFFAVAGTKFLPDDNQPEDKKKQPERSKAEERPGEIERPQPRESPKQGKTESGVTKSDEKIITEIELKFSRKMGSLAMTEAYGVIRSGKNKFTFFNKSTKYQRLYHYLIRLVKVTGQEPIKRETSKKFVHKALLKAATQGRLDKVKF